MKGSHLRVAVCSFLPMMALGCFVRCLENKAFSGGSNCYDAPNILMCVRKWRQLDNGDLFASFTSTSRSCCYGNSSMADKLFPSDGSLVCFKAATSEVTLAPSTTLTTITQSTSEAVTPTTSTVTSTTTGSSSAITPAAATATTTSATPISTSQSTKEVVTLTTRTTALTNTTSPSTITGTTATTTRPSTTPTATSPSTTEVVTTRTTALTTTTSPSTTTETTVTTTGPSTTPTATEVVTLMTTTRALTTTAGICQASWTRIGDRCFKHINNLVNWADAQAHCQSLGGNLAHVDALSDFNGFGGIFTCTVGEWGCEPWLGINDLAAEGNLVGVVGQTVLNTLVATVTGNNNNKDCTFCNGFDSVLFIRSCTDEDSFICESILT